MKFLLAVVLFASSLPAFAQKVFVEHEGSDMVGTQFVYAFKEAVRQSSTFQIVDSPSKVVTVEFVTLDNSPPDSNGIGSAISTVVSVDMSSPSCGACKLDVHHSVYLVGANRVSQVAANLLADLDKTLGSIRASFQKANDDEATTLQATQGKR